MNKRDPDDITCCPDCLRFVHSSQLIGGHDCPPDFITPEESTDSSMLQKVGAGLSSIVDSEHSQCQVCGGWFNLHHEYRDGGERQS